MVKALDTITRFQSVIGAGGLKVFGADARILSTLAHQTAASAASDAEGTEGATSVSGGAKPALFYRKLDVVVREGHKREKRRLRRHGLWIPSSVQGRGKFPDIQIKVPVAPLQEDFYNGLFAIQKLGKSKWSGPLYQLRFIQEEHAEDEESRPLPVPTLPFETIRVKAHNMMLNQITEAVKCIMFVYCPENEPVRMRVPIRYINEEKCPGLREGGWLNRMQQNVDINVAPFTKAPLFATQDIGRMRIKDKKTIGELEFEGKGLGCQTILPDDTVATIISKI